mgnify:FL=1
MKIILKKELSGRILDIGGGGEGVIGRLYHEQVTAIDNRQEELDETPSGFEKVLMDATDLDYADGSFNHVTCFFTLMYMTAAEQRQCILEAARVLKKGGALHIWDCDIVSAYPEPFCVDVEICLPAEHISTTYGIGKLDCQDMASFSVLCMEAGLTLVCRQSKGGSFYLKFLKFS